MATFSSREFGRTKVTQKENQTRQVKGLSAANTKTRAQKRTVLGSITNVRIQPSRAAKVDGAKQDENAGIPQLFEKSKSQPFSIYVDDDPPVLSAAHVHPAAVNVRDDDIENRIPTLDDAVACLPVIPQHAAQRPEAKVPSYCLDMSGVEEEDDDDSTENESASAAALAELEEQDRGAVIEEVPEYADDIYTYLLTVEHKNRPRPGFMRRQDDVTLPMRSILVDWLVEVAEEYKLQRETLFLAVSYIDRFLAQMSVLRSKLQLVGAAAMFLAAKYEEIYPPDVNEFVYITDDTYQKKQILRMEHMILKVLKFDIATPTVNWFCERLLRSVQAERNLQHFTMYICELVLVENEKFLVFPSSLVAASALCLAYYTLGKDDFWPCKCREASRYTLAQLVPCVQMMYDLHCNAEHHPQQAIREKYKLAKYDGVADLCAHPILCLV